MIVSRYWRAELKNDLAWLKRHRVFTRWSEKQLVLFERRIMLVAFQVRTLLERPKVNDAARRTRISALRYKKNSGDPFVVLGGGWPEEHFDMARPEPINISIIDVCNQLIHHYWMETRCEGKTFSSMLVFSDYKRHEWAYEFQIVNLLELFRRFAEDTSRITSMTAQWNDNRQDYVVAQSLGPADAANYRPPPQAARNPADLPPNS
jgi:hypothetical protein